MQVSSTQEFSNVYLFVSDALRYDYIPDSVVGDNQLIKTVSSSGVSCTAFSTLVSGLYPPRHGVWKFSDLISDSITTIYDLFPSDCPSHLVVTPVVESRDNAIHYNHTPEFESALREVTEPFFVFDRELCSHAVYGQHGGNHIEEREQEFSTTDEYWRTRGEDIKTIKREYRQGAKEAAYRFEKRVESLREMDVLEDTLVVFTADHGEALGEHGMVGHTNVPLAPEIVYVPTVFHNDKVTANGEFMGHVDLLPTIAALTGKEVPDGLDGYDLTRGAPDERILFNADSRRGGHVYGAWDDGGGHTFTSVPLYLRMARAIERLTRNNRAKMHRQNVSTILTLPFQQSRTFGDPGFDRERAEVFCEEIFTKSISSESQKLDEKAKQRLRALGYAEEDI